MKKFSFTIACVLILIGSILSAQTIPDKIYYNRLYYTGKVWGFVKYFHSEIAKGNINWDLKLIETLSKIKSNISNQDFNYLLSSMIDMAGEMAVPASPLLELPDSLKYNLDLNWLNDAIFSDEVRARLDTIKTRFRPQSNHFVGNAFVAGNPTFDNDNQLYEWGVNQYPGEEYRLLALFRYWNIINYFYPYKYIIDQHWDSTLVEFIPDMVSAQDSLSFHLSFLELATRINDSHAFTYSKIINENIFGMYYLPLTIRNIENETVITGVFTDNEAIKIGDIVKSINGIDIYTLRDSLKKFTTGSNTPAIERNINTRLLRGPNHNVQMTLENSEGQKDIILSRNVYITDYSNLTAKKDAIWKILDADSGKYGYVDMGRLEIHPTIAGIREGRDEVLEAALQYNPTSIADYNYSTQTQLPDTYLFQNYPNPFSPLGRGIFDNPSTTIEFTLPQSSIVKLKIYNILGKEVASLVSERLAAGNYQYHWTATGMPAGVYFYQLRADKFSQTRKMILIS